MLKRLNPLMHRLGLNLYAGPDHASRTSTGRKRGHIERFSSIASTNSRGLELVFFPILIAALIVLNTMLGSVFERVKEIHIFSSIGLAPSHIGMLFIAEALVYAILGSVAGYLLGQFTSKILVWTRWLPDLYLNFSSVERGPDDLDRRRRRAAVHHLPGAQGGGSRDARHRPNLEGAGTGRRPLDVPLPFAVTGAQASGLNWLPGRVVPRVRGVQHRRLRDAGRRSARSSSTTTALAYRIKCMTWLAPFDLGVSQRVAIETTPTDTPDVYDIRLLIDRESGDISNWKRVNRRFLNTLRKQFLIWRTLKQADRERYVREEREEQRRQWRK